MKKKPIFISFGTQKGGAGKSSFSILAASLLHYKMGYDVAIIDCDYPQSSLVKMRERDSAQASESPLLKSLLYKQFNSTGQKKAYPIENTLITEAMSAAKNLTEKSEVGYDFIFFDVPGTVNQKGALMLAAQMDYIFCPVKARGVDTSSTVEFILTVQDGVIKKDIGNLKRIYAFWNMVDAREKTPIYGRFSEFCAKNDISLLETKIPYLVRFGREVSDKEDGVFLSTILPPSTSQLRGSNVAFLVDEVLEKVGKK